MFSLVGERESNRIIILKPVYFQKDWSSAQRDGRSLNLRPKSRAASALASQNGAGGEKERLHWQGETPVPISAQGGAPATAVQPHPFAAKHFFSRVPPVPPLIALAVGKPPRQGRGHSTHPFRSSSAATNFSQFLPQPSWTLVPGRDAEIETKALLPLSKNQAPLHCNHHQRG